MVQIFDKNRIFLKFSTNFPSKNKKKQNAAAGGEMMPELDKVWREREFAASEAARHHTPRSRLHSYHIPFLVGPRCLSTRCGSAQLFAAAGSAREELQWQRAHSRVRAHRPSRRGMIRADARTGDGLPRRLRRRLRGLSCQLRE